MIPRLPQSHPSIFAHVAHPSHPGGRIWCRTIRPCCLVLPDSRLRHRESSTILPRHGFDLISHTYNRCAFFFVSDAFLFRCTNRFRMSFCEAVQSNGNDLVIFNWPATYCVGDYALVSASVHWPSTYCVGVYALISASVH